MFLSFKSIGSNIQLILHIAVNEQKHHLTVSMSLLYTRHSGFNASLWNQLRLFNVRMFTHRRRYRSYDLPLQRNISCHSSLLTSGSLSHIDQMSLGSPEKQL